MRAFLAFFLFLLAALLLSTLLNFPLYLLVQDFLDKPPHKLITRGAIAFALLGFWFFLARMGLANRRAVGYGAPRPDFLRSIILGWLAGIVILSVLALALLALGVRAPDPAQPGFWSESLRTGLSGLIAGLAVGVIEETFFRGALFTAMRRQGSLLSAILVPSVFYASLHFVSPAPLAAGASYNWSSGWLMLGGALHRVGEPGTLDSLIALTAVGIFLGIVRERTGHIGYCIGLHAGWVLIIKLTRRFTHEVPDAGLSYLIGSYDGITGYLAACWIGLLALILCLWPRRLRRDQTSG